MCKGDKQVLNAVYVENKIALSSEKKNLSLLTMHYYIMESNPTLPLVNQMYKEVRSELHSTLMYKIQVRIQIFVT